MTLNLAGNPFNAPRPTLAKPTELEETTFARTRPISRPTRIRRVEMHWYLSQRRLLTSLALLFGFSLFRKLNTSIQLIVNRRI